MKINELEEYVHDLHYKVISQVKVSCDDEHYHTATQNCLSGDENAIIACKACEVALRLLSHIKSFDDVQYV